jgi:putative transposase
MTDAQRAEVLALRQRQGQPWHGPPHGLENQWYHLASTCYEHAPVIGYSPTRMATFEAELLEALQGACARVMAWCVLPNHYHVLAQCTSLPFCRHAVGLLHGRTSHDWNREEQAMGRTCWHRCLPRAIVSEAQRWATLNYIHHNPVHHGYVARWQEWPFSSSCAYLEAVGRESAERFWRQFPIDWIGLNWDDPER